MEQSTHGKDNSSHYVPMPSWWGANLPSAQSPQAHSAHEAAAASQHPNIAISPSPVDESSPAIALATPACTSTAPWAAAACPPASPSDGMPEPQSSTFDPWSAVMEPSPEEPVPTSVPTCTTESLTPKHRADLHASGLSDQQIAACGFFSVRSAEVVHYCLNWPARGGELGGCLAFPYRDADGEPTRYVRLKPDNPRESDGKLVKYESPRGSKNRAYFPPGMRAAIKDPSVALLITEGEKKVAKADQEGFACVGLVGVWGWQKKRDTDFDGLPLSERELIDDLAQLPWQGRLVHVCFDSDVATNPKVWNAERCLAEALQRLGAEVKVIRLPGGDPGPDGKPAKVGLDDFLMQNGADNLRALLDAAVAGEQPEPEPYEDPENPHRLARVFLACKYHHDDGMTLRFWRDEWNVWRNSAYQVISPKELKAEVTAVVKAEMDRLNVVAQKRVGTDGPVPSVRHVTPKMITGVLHALESLAILPFGTEAPSWIGGSSHFPADEVLACRNGLIYLPAFAADTAPIMPPTPRFFTSSCLEFDFDANAPTPDAWLTFLRKLWPDDNQSIETLQEWFGYLLTLDTRQQKILLLVGPKRSGKGTIARVMRGLVGARNIANPTISGLVGNFALAPLIGKSVAIIPDARIGGKSDPAALIERLLSISGEDALTIDRKHLAQVTTKLTARFVLISNELPKLNDSSGAFASRMILLRLTQSWLGNEDINLTGKLMAELPGILLWAIQGWRRLRERGHFVQPDSAQEMVRELEHLGSPIAAFIEECCLVEDGGQVEKKWLFSRWEDWCEGNGHHAGSSSVFGRSLRSAVPTLGDCSLRAQGGRAQMYTGIRLS
jgi:putative DNA primase/helicase